MPGLHHSRQPIDVATPRTDEQVAVPAVGKALREDVFRTWGVFRPCLTLVIGSEYRVRRSRHDHSRRRHSEDRPDVLVEIQLLPGVAPIARSEDAVLRCQEQITPLRDRHGAGPVGQQQRTPAGAPILRSVCARVVEPEIEITPRRRKQERGKRSRQSDVLPAAGVLQPVDARVPRRIDDSRFVTSEVVDVMATQPLVCRQPRPAAVARPHQGCAHAVRLPTIECRVDHAVAGHGGPGPASAEADLRPRDTAIGRAKHAPCCSDDEIRAKDDGRTSVRRRRQWLRGGTIHAIP